MAGDVNGSLDRAVHDRDVRPQSHLVRGAVREQPLLGVHLVWTDDRPDLVVEDLRRGTGKRREPGVLQAQEALRGHHHERPRARVERLPPQQVEVLRGGGAVDDADVLLRRELEEALQPGAGVLLAV